MKKIKQKDNFETMNSIAIWWNKQDDVKVHFDVNIWHTKRSKDNYLEFGIKIKNYNELENINIYVPYKITKKDIEDKVDILSSDPSLTRAMFNENLDVTPSDGSFCDVKFHKETEESFSYCKLNVEKDITIINDKTIKLDINKTSKNTETIYYRFRINKIEKIFTELKENYFWIDGFFKTIGFIEVNINSVRKLPDNIVDNLKDVKFDSMNLFMMTDNFTSFIFQSKDTHKSRILENHIWESHLQIQISTSS